VQNCCHNLTEINLGEADIAMPDFSVEEPLATCDTKAQLADNENSPLQVRLVLPAKEAGRVIGRDGAFSAKAAWSCPSDDHDGRNYRASHS